MTETDKLFAGSVPELYERLMVPLIFADYARDMAERVVRVAPQDILETAAGTGAVTRALTSRLAANVRYVATDLNQPMLDHAAAKQPDRNRVTWRQADALALPFGDQQFDAVVCQFGAMFFPDKVAAYREAHRVLKPRGHFFFSVWDRISTNEFADVITEAMVTLFPQDPPRFLARTPHGYYDLDRIREELIAAGFANVTFETIDHRSRAASPRDPAIAYCEGTPLRNEIEARGASRLDEATTTAADAIAQRFGHGAVDGLIRAHLISATG